MEGIKADSKYSLKLLMKIKPHKGRIILFKVRLTVEK